MDIYCQLQILGILSISLIFGYIVDTHYIPYLLEGGYTPSASNSWWVVDIHNIPLFFNTWWIHTVSSILNRYPPYLPIYNMGWIPAILSNFQYVEDIHHVANF